MSFLVITPKIGIKNGSTTPFANTYTEMNVVPGVGNGFRVDNKDSNVVILIKNSALTSNKAKIEIFGKLCSHGREGSIILSGSSALDGGNTVILGPFDASLYEGSVSDSLDIEISVDAGNLVASNISAFAVKVDI